MAPFVARIAELSSRVDATSDSTPLTKREGEVADLVGQGMTNRAIAERLYLSERTVENHVQHILTKLGLSNRSQVAVWVATRK
jgi:DNA-binding NarL/FixJ family response regulator